MSCTTSPASTISAQRLRDLEVRIRKAENTIAGIKEIYGVCAAESDLTVPVLEFSLSESTNKFTVKFSSTPGEGYQIQVSTDGVNWTIALNGNFVTAATGTAVFTSWTSTDTYLPEDMPVYFRVRRYPVAGPIV
jgi:hypothetical protein